MNTRTYFLTSIILDAKHEKMSGTTKILSVYKVRTFWETHEIWKNLPHGFDKSADLLSEPQNHE